MNRLFPLFILFLCAACTSADKTGVPISCLQISDGDTICICDLLPAHPSITAISSKDCSVSLLDDQSFIVGNNDLQPLNVVTLTSGRRCYDVLFINSASPRSQERVTTAHSGKKGLSLQWSRQPCRLVALWQNEQIEVSGDTLLPIPPRARQIGHSVIRVWGECNGAITNDLWIPLNRGEVVRKVSDLPETDSRRIILYSLMIDRFANGNPDNDAPLNREDVLKTVDWQGGDFAGITRKIDEGFFSDLGVNTLLITPIAKNADGAWGLDTLPYTRFSAYHGYWPVEPTRLEERFGTETELRTMLDRAHAKGLHVLLDIVANHLHQESHLLREHPDWTTDMYLPDGLSNIRLFDEHRLTTWFDTFLPTLDLSRTDVAEPISDSALYWLQHFDFDGFRHDAAKHIDKCYWRMLTRKIRRRIDRPIFQIGETYGDYSLVRSYVNSGMLDSQFDFMLFHTAQNAFGTGKADMNDLGRALIRSLENYGFHHVMGNITGNHDKPRFISVAGGDVSLDEDTKAAGRRRKIGISDTAAYRKLTMLEAFQFAIPGIPCIYQGDDYGVAGANDPDNRKMMRFEGYSRLENEVRNKLVRLAELRGSRMPLLYGDLIRMESTPETLCFTRSYLGEPVIAVFNNSAERRCIRYGHSSDQPLTGHFNGKIEQGADSLTVTLEPYAFEILTIK